MKGYLNYLITNLKNGNFTTGILIFITIIGFVMLNIIGLTFQNKYIGISSVVWFLFGTAICISWAMYWYDKHKQQ